MSNSLAIATVTATLSQLIQDEIQVEVPGATVSTVRPDIAGNNPAESKVNVFLYQVTTNASLRNIDLPSRRGAGSLSQKPRSAFDLHYLLTFYGDETTLVPQRLLGSTLRTLHSEPQLTRQRIIDTVNSLSYLTGSTLADDPELVKFTPLPLSIEELSKLWSILLSTPYALSIIFLGTVVLIESDEIPVIPRPVRTPVLTVTPFRQPIIDQLLSQKDIDEPLVSHPIFTGDKLILVGKQFKSADPAITTLVQVGNTPVTTKDEGVNRLSFILDNTLQAGIQSVQIVQQLLLGKPPVPHYGFESNVMPFVLRPTVDSADRANVQSNGNGLFSADVTVTLTPQMGAKQRVVLVLNTVLGSPTSAAYSFISEARPADTDTLSFSITGVSPATYIVSVQVDGAQSVVDDSGHTIAIP